MKKTASIFISDRRAIDYICLKSPVQAKKILFAMSLLKGDQRLGDSNVAEVRRIAELYNGVINAACAKELAAALSDEYSKCHPGVLLTKKKMEAYTDARYVKLYDALGHYGFDYVVTALKQGKAYVANPENGIVEKHMLSALRWNEKREGVDAAASNERHRCKGLQLVGLGDMLEVLLPYSFIIANVYELVTPEVQTVWTDGHDGEEENEASGPMTLMDMLFHLLENAHLLKDFYGTSKPVVPEGYAEDELVEGTTTYKLAKSNLLVDPEVVLKYIEHKKMYESCQKRIAEVFSAAEVKLITEKEETIKEILRLVDSL